MHSLGSISKAPDALMTRAWKRIMDTIVALRESDNCRKPTGGINLQESAGETQYEDDPDLQWHLELYEDRYGEGEQHKIVDNIERRENTA